MTTEREMGEKKGGAGSTEGATTVQILKHTARRLQDQDRTVQEVHVQPIIPQRVYAVEVFCAGEVEPERWIHIEFESKS